MNRIGTGTRPRDDAPADVLDMLQTSVALIGIYDAQEVLQYTNAAFRAAYAVGPDERVDWRTLMRRNFAAGIGTVIKTDDIEGWISSVRSRRGKTRQRTYESDLHDGRFMWVTETMRDDGWIIYVGTDVTQLNASERHLRLARDALLRQSATDDLTGISNRRHILARLQEVLDSAQDGWACVLDIDHFKRINDSYGHQTGDDVLVRFARAVRGTIRLRDAFGRVGGEEFLILFATPHLSEASTALQRIRDALTAETIGLPDVTLTVSGGLTAIAAGDTQAQILRRADLALYCAKQNGRNQIRLALADDPPSDPLLLSEARR